MLKLTRKGGCLIVLGFLVGTIGIVATATHPTAEGAKAFGLGYAIMGTTGWGILYMAVGYGSMLTGLTRALRVGFIAIYLTLFLTGILYIAGPLFFNASPRAFSQSVVFLSIAMLPLLISGFPEPDGSKIAEAMNVPEGLDGEDEDS